MQRTAHSYMQLASQLHVLFVYMDQYIYMYVYTVCELSACKLLANCYTNLPRFNLYHKFVVWISTSLLTSITRASITLICKTQSMGEQCSACEEHMHVALVSTRTENICTYILITGSGPFPIPQPNTSNRLDSRQSQPSDQLSVSKNRLTIERCSLSQLRVCWLLA